MILRKHNMYLILVMLLFPLMGLGATQQDIFKNGNDAYAKGQYQAAINNYEQLIDSGYQQFELYYNLGNANYKAGNIASAILNYERAKKIDPGNEDVDVNLDFANQKIVDKIEGVPEFFLKKWWIAFIMKLRVDTWATIAVAFFLVGFFSLIIYLMSPSPKIKRSSFYGGIVALLIACCLLAVANSQANYFETRTDAIVFKGTVNVKSAPAEKHKTLFIVHEGIKVRVLDNIDAWIKIELPNGGIGWIPSNTVELI